MSLYAAVRDETGFAAVEAWPLELASLASVKAFVSRFNEDGGDLNLIVENAGIATREYNLTMDGYEETYVSCHQEVVPLLTQLSGCKLTTSQAPCLGCFSCPAS